MSDDFTKRRAGQVAHSALVGLDGECWLRCKELSEEAMRAYEADELTPERARSLWVSLLEHQKLVGRLKGLVEEGTRAGKRIEQRAERRQIELAEETRAKTEGRNRWTRSRGPGPPSEVASSEGT